MNEPETLQTEIPLLEPHFDEEATVLQARPVVPLTTVRAETRSRRNFFFVLALVGALMIGAVGGTLVYKQRATPVTTASEDLQQPNETDSEISTPAEEITASASGGTTNEPVAEEPQDTAPAPKTQTNLPVPVKTQERVTPRPVYVERNRVEEDEAAQRQARKEARRERRVTRREERARRESDDVLRIRDIFEGSTPP